MPELPNGKEQMIEVPQPVAPQEWVGHMLYVLQHMSLKDALQHVRELKMHFIDQQRRLGTPDGWNQDQQDALMNEAVTTHEYQLLESELKNLKR